MFTIDAMTDVRDSQESDPDDGFSDTSSYYSAEHGVLQPEPDEDIASVPRSSLILDSNAAPSEDIRKYQARSHHPTIELIMAVVER